MGHKRSVEHTVNVARTIVKLLEQLNITCILISDIAGYLLSRSFDPKNRVTVAIIPSYEGTLSREQVAVMLVEAEPTKLRIRHKKNGTFKLSCFEDSGSCAVELVDVCNPPPPEYTVEHVIYVDGLPVGSMLPLIINELHMLPFTTAHKRHNPSKLPRRFSNINWIHGHESLRQEALQSLRQMSSILPELSSKLSPLIQECLTASSVVALIRSKAASSVAEVPPVPSVPIDVNLDLHPRFEPRLPDISSLATESAPEASHPPQTLPSRKAPRAPLKTEVVCLVAKTVVDIVRETGVECALFGSLACYLYGNTRSPNDIDLIAFSTSQEPMDAERLKRVIVEHDSTHFRLEAPKDPTATYRILYFIVDQGLAPANTFHRNRCKIDVLVPGLLHLPSLSGNNIKWRGGLPVVPFPVLLLQKLQGWDDHMHMDEHFKFIKHKTDASDVQALLELEHVVSLRFSQPWGNRTLFSQEFMALSRKRIIAFCKKYPESTAEWTCLGFAV